MNSKKFTEQYAREYEASCKARREAEEEAHRWLEAIVGRRLPWESMEGRG